MGCATGTIKLIIFTFNFLLVCIGFGMVLVGIMDTTNTGDFADVKDLIQDISLLSKVLIVAGAIVFFVAFFGCWGTVTESPCMLLLYAIFLIALVLLEATVVVYGYMHRDTVQKEVTGTFNTMIKEYGAHGNATVEVIDRIQMKLQCCGTESPDDWHKNAKFPGQLLPSSCCSEKPATCTTDKANNRGCLTVGMELLKDKLKKYAWIVGAVFLCEVVAIYSAFMIRNGIIHVERNEELASLFRMYSCINV